MARLLVFLILSFFISCFEKENKPAIKGTLKIKDSLIQVMEEKYDSPKALQLDSLFNVWIKLNKFNGNVLIAQQGKIILKKCYGLANFDTKEPLQYNSAFQLASVSKQFTAVAIMMLKEQGKINYSDPVCNYLQNFPYPKITIKMLLSHRSGLANYMYFCEGYCQNHDDPIDNKEVLKLLIEKKPETYQKPDRRFYYNNTNYCLLALIVEKVSGTSLGDFMKKNAFAPLAMTNTWIKSDFGDTLHPNITKGYESIWKKGEINYLDGVVGDKNVYSTIEDLYKWDQALYTNQLLKQETLQEAFSPQNKEMRGIRNYGFGWRLFNYPNGTKIVYHNGWWHGYNTSFCRRVSDKTTVIILSNFKNKTIFQTQQIYRILDGVDQNSELEDKEENT